MGDEPAGGGLSAGRFDWAASILDKRGPDTDSERNTSLGEERYKISVRRPKSRQI